ncbi:MAG TPA: hypothetical protein VM101_11560 [Flavitalea sp.]|nr:hypothetical protein [Flavitalea sp.]
MNVEQRVVLMEKLGKYIVSDAAEWITIKEKAAYENPWFIPEFTNYQLQHIAREFLDSSKLESWIRTYNIPSVTSSPKNIGIVMAGNIPLAGFHDFLSVFISGHHQTIKPSSKDFQLINGIINKLKEWDEGFEEYVKTSDQLKNCDAYIATGSNNSSRYFDYYFSKYPHIIRRNRTSAAILTGNETLEDLDALADDVYLYFGLGCRNVTKIYVPENFDFLPLLETFKKYNWAFDIHKYKNNYDYQLAVMIINNIYYMTNGSILLRKDKALFSPVSVLHYEQYDDLNKVEESLASVEDIQCIVGKNHIPFGKAQQPLLNDYADKADTLQFLRDL